MQLCSFAYNQTIKMDSFQETYKEPPYNMTDLPFNFMIGMDGETYEGRGWDIISDLTLENKNISIFLGVIGTYVQYTM